jgi:hypothetical protein
MKNIEHAQKQLQELLDSQQLAVLSTEQNEHPYASLVGFVATDNDNDDDEIFDLHEEAPHVSSNH